MSVVSIRGERSTGKSTFCATWPGRKHWWDYERGAIRALDAKDKEGKPRFPNWKNTTTLWHPADEEGVIDLILAKLDYTVRGMVEGQVEMWAVLQKKFVETVKMSEVDAIVLDTARLVWQTCHQAHLQALQQAAINEGSKPKQTLGSFEYATPNARMEGLIMAATAMNKDLLLINHERPIYVPAVEAETGRHITVPSPDGATELDGFNKTLNYADWGFVATYDDHSDPKDRAKCIAENKVRYGGCLGFHFHVQIEKSPIGAEFRGMIIDSVNYADIKAAIEERGGTI